MSTLIAAMRNLGRADALALQKGAAEMTGTEIIRSEHWRPGSGTA